MLFMPLYNLSILSYCIIDYQVGKLANMHPIHPNLCKYNFPLQKEEEEYKKELNK